MVAVRVATQDERLHASGISPLRPEAVAAHMAAELAAAPKRTRFARTQIFVRRTILGCALAAMAFGILTAFASLLIAMSGTIITAIDSASWLTIGATAVCCVIVGYVTAVIFDSSTRIYTSDARWVEKGINPEDRQYYLPREIRLVALKASGICPRSTFITHELMQDSVVLDPILELRSPDGERSFLAIWKDNDVIALA